MTNFYNKSAVKSKISFAFFVQLFLINSVTAQITFDPPPTFFRTSRQLPLVGLTTVKDISVSKYGAIVNDGKDDLSSLQAAFDAAKELSSYSNPVRVVFEKGVYDIMPTGTEAQCLFLSGANYMVFEGNGCEIRNHNPAVGALQVRTCGNIIFKNLNFDYATLPFTQGKVTEIDLANNSFNLKIDDGFPLLTESHFTTAGQKWACLKDSSGKLKTGANNLFPNKGWTQISGNLFKVNLPNKMYTSQLEVGDYFVQIARFNGKTILNTQLSKNITYLDINIYASPAGSFNGQDNFEFNIINCKVIPKPGTQRVHSGNADIIHITGSYFGPWVQGCLFEGYTDDAVNLKHAARNIQKVVSPTTINVKGNLTINDKIVLFNPREGNLLATGLKIESVTALGGNIFQVTFNGEHMVSEVGDTQRADKIYLTNRSCESFIFRNNTFKNGRRYGILLQSSFGQIKDCKFENLSSSGVKMENGVDWGEGFIANNIAVTNNTFINCGFDASYKSDPDAAAISTMVSKLKTPCASEAKWCGVEPSKWQGIENIIITDNYFLYNKSAIDLQNLNNALILNNKYVHNTKDTTIAPNEVHQGVKTFNCSNLHFEDLKTKSEGKK
jgi:hypothetical protein